MRIALLDYEVQPSNPIGHCHLRVLRALADEHEFTVYAVAFDNPSPERIRWVRVPVVRRPLVAQFVTYHLSSPVVRLIDRLRTRARFDLVQIVGSNALRGDLDYAHFCNRTYLQRYWKLGRPSGTRRLARFLDHWAMARVEPITFRRVSRAVVPSRGVARDLVEAYPVLEGRVDVIPNAADTEAAARPAGFDTAAFRVEHGLPTDRLVLAFVALGHFERKGLPLILEAMALLGDDRPHLLLVGGEASMLTEYAARSAALGLDGDVTFAGKQDDVFPFLWASDAFLNPSHYEAFSLVGLEAAAAGLPLIATRVNGMEDLLVDGRNGFAVEATGEGVADGIRRFLELSPEGRAALGAAATEDVQRFDEDHFADAWRELYRTWEKTL